VTFFTVLHRISDSGLSHILKHHGSTRSDVYRRLFQILWFGNGVGKTEDVEKNTPTYVYPVEIRAVIRERFPDTSSGRRDDEFDRPDKGAFVVSWEHIAIAKWPKPPKSCRVCAGSTKKPY
jgi:hypothetical protein